MADPEILGQIAESQEKTRRELREEVENLFRKERDSFNERIHLFLNTAKWSGATLLAVFGLLGIKAWGDIKTNVEEYFKTRLEKIYRLEDASSPISRSIEQLMDRALVNALYVQVQRAHNTTNTGNRLRMGAADRESLSSGELERLLRIVRNPQTEALAFEDTIVVLNALVSSDERRQAVSSTLAGLVAAKEKSDSSWMASNERKRLAILTSFRNSEEIDAVAGELLGQPISDRLKSSALTRIGKVKYRAATPSIIKFIDTADGQELKFLGYRTLALLRPDHDRLKNYILSDLIKREEKIDLLNCLSMAATLAQRVEEHPFFEDSDDRQRHLRILTELAIPLAAKALESGVTMEFEDFGFRNGLHARIATGSSSSHSSWVSSAIYSNDFVSELLNFGAKKSIYVLSQYISALSINSERSFSRQPRVKMLANLTDDSELQFEDGTKVTRSQLKGESVELATNSEKLSARTGTRNEGTKDYKIHAIWENLEGTRSKKQLRSIKNVTFFVTANLNGQSEDEAAEF